MDKIFLYIIIILSAVFHEYSHGWMAYRLGDPTAKNAGRLTLNPISHIDPIGTVILPIFLLMSSGIFIGWAKPVPFNPYNLRDSKYGTLKVAAAGPLSNLGIAIFIGLILRLLFVFLPTNMISLYFIQFLMYLKLIIYINIFLALFNLIPFPPLDGSKIFAGLFPNQWKHVEQLGFFGILIAMFIAFSFLSPIANFLFYIITGQGFGF
ncbi:site-2 protease family protein [Patescibacteria group bacterium]|nr:site-2 protease family protein [Patescibacteria group bacterium]